MLIHWVSFHALKISDNTLRFPSTKTFLSQDICLDKKRPLAFGKDVVFMVALKQILLIKSI